MKAKIKRGVALAAISAGLILAGPVGCAGNLSRMMNAAAKDQAIVVGKLQTVYGTMSLTRIGGTTNAVTVSPDGTVTVNK